MMTAQCTTTASSMTLSARPHMRRRFRSSCRLQALLDASSSLSEAKRATLRAVSGTRKLPRESTSKDVMLCVEAVERVASAGRAETSKSILSPIDGDWTLVYSTKTSSGVIREDDSLLDGLGEVGESALDAVTSALYATFFKFAPFLAGSAETNQRGVRNTQRVDSLAGIVRNEVFVDAQLPLPFFTNTIVLRIGVEGEVKLLGDLSGSRAEVIFTSFDLGLTSSSVNDDRIEPAIKFPLPRPRGTLDTTFCDDTLRISRGGRGGVFILTRM
jgi:hypothetical protein